MKSSMKSPQEVNEVAVAAAVKEKKASLLSSFWPYKILLLFFKKIDQKVDHSIKFFLKHFLKTPFMVAMSKKIQMHGVEKVFNMGPKAFFYFFMFYLIRDTILYIILPIYFARMTGD